MVTITGKRTLTNAKRLIVKVGSSLLVSPTSLEYRQNWMNALAQDIAKIRAGGCEVVLVSSGAVALGKQQYQPKTTRPKLEDIQALAAIGQVRLAGAWAAAFAPFELSVGQVLLTLDDTENRRRWLNSSSTLRALLQMSVVPLINENDSVASDEIRYGDNDRLAARTAQMVGADVLVLLSDVDGLYASDPCIHENARHLPLVEHITPKIEQMAGGSAGALGSGGMVTKIMAARIAGFAGCATIIANGEPMSPLSALMAGAKNTLFLPQIKPAQARKNWIAGALQPKGEITIDAGAAAALSKGASLLAAGITKVDGNFERGEVVSIQGPNRIVLARGITSYDVAELQKIQGLQSDDIHLVLGYAARKAVIHRDNLMVMGEGNTDDAES